MKQAFTPIKRKFLQFTLLLTLFCAQPILAQDGFDDDVDDETPAVPIDGSYIVMGLLAGAYVGIKKLKARQLSS